MNQWYGFAILVLSVFCIWAVVRSGVQIIRTLITVSKCPDCGRIMQHVMYSGIEDFEMSKKRLECPFCQAKHIRPIHRGKKLTMYP